ncbi:HAMP domain-containing histidine kinase [Reichenbachiella agarivorans]|uniref:histidine kinase n=1 Tax=Reichenbachiella agarivorans TaxID=2979464 RepID=A0ABY6CQ59_9BACT|nr:HAMP domain-containing sensor histidine kinase [Reichenbachiella agarivorans]UXP32666.1 HAMP domain-containing histidine kinase [Reichenbachiella agarivorans]
MTKLLDKPFRIFTVYALIILIGSVPVYYIVVDHIWLHELDEHNLIIKDRIIGYFDQQTIDSTELRQTINAWKIMQPGTSLNLVQEIGQDSIYEITKQNIYAPAFEIDRFRGYQTYLHINGLPYRMIIETNIEEADETLVAIAVVTIAFFILLVIGFIYLNKRIAKGIWHPFHQTLQTLQSFDLSQDNSIALGETDIEEFAQLNTALSELVAQNISVYQQQKVFIENASHELQTPLAILKSKLDILLQQDNLTQQQSDLLNAIGLPLSRISRINKNLLLLAKIENSQFNANEEIDLTQLIDKTIHLFADYFDEKTLNISFQYKTPLTIVCSPYLAETLIHNLLSNAIRHSPVGGTVQIHVADQKLSIQNTGTASLKVEKLFQRFAVSTAETTNSGLGLAIVKEICARYHWEVSYDFQSNFHIFSVSFPKF